MQDFLYQIITHWHNGFIINNDDQYLLLSWFIISWVHFSNLPIAPYPLWYIWINVFTDWEPCYNYCDIKSSMCLVIISGPVHSTKCLVTAYPLWHVQVPEPMMILTDRKICFNCYDIKSRMCLAILSKWKELPTKYSYTYHKCSWSLTYQLIIIQNVLVLLTFLIKDQNYTHAFFSSTHISWTPIYPGYYLLDSHFSGTFWWMIIDSYWFFKERIQSNEVKYDF